MGTSLFGRKALLIASCILAAGSLSPASIIYDVDAGGDIEDANGGAKTTDFTFTISQSGTIQDLNVRLAIGHSFVEDLTITLSSPGDAVTVTLFDTYAGNPDADFQDTLLDDTNTFSFLGTQNPPYAGTYRPGVNEASDDLSEFNGLSMTGTWTLSITDHAAGDDGHLYKAGDGTPSGWSSLTGTQLILEIPEPLAAGVLALGGMVILVRRRRRLA
jgi:subtilisin-like proprotein convertase family protein